MHVWYACCPLLVAAVIDVSCIYLRVLLIMYPICLASLVFLVVFSSITIVFIFLFPGYRGERGFFFVARSPALLVHTHPARAPRPVSCVLPVVSAARPV